MEQSKQENFDKNSKKAWIFDGGRHKRKNKVQGGHLQCLFVPKASEEENR